MENLKVLNVDVNTTYGKVDLDLSDVIFELDLSNTYVERVGFNFNNLTITENMAPQLERKLVDLLNEYLDTNYDINFDDRYEIEGELYDFLWNRRNFAVYELEDLAKELLENEIKEEAKEFLVGILETIDDGEEDLADHFYERKDGGYYLELGMYFWKDTRHIVAEFDSCSLQRGTHYNIGEAIIEFDY